MTIMSHPAVPPMAGGSEDAAGACDLCSEQRQCSDHAPGTPPPWTIERHGTEYPDLFTYNVLAPRGWQEPSGEYKVCSVTHDLDNLADARLIAAAPDLLQLCRQVLARLDVEATERGEGAIFPCAALRDELRAVIAAATGQDG